MAMNVQVVSGGRKQRAHPEMNVTPLVDVVLVLLIIFMVLTAMMNEQFWVHVPEKPKDEPAAEEEDLGDVEVPIVVSVTRAGQIKINQDIYPEAQFPERLRRMLVAKGDRRIYFDAENGVPFERAMHVMDLARGGGAAHIAAVTEKID